MGCAYAPNVCFNLIHRRELHLKVHHSLSIKCVVAERERERCASDVFVEGVHVRAGGTLIKRALVCQSGVCLRVMIASYFEVFGSITNGNHPSNNSFVDA